MELAEHIDTVIIGGGQAGLVTGVELQRRGVPFVIVDAHERTGDSWRKRWDSLRLFTTARFNSLPGLPFPGRGDRFISKDEMADYVESYAKHFDLPISHRERVERLSRLDSRFIVATNRRVLQAENVIVAMANYQKPRVPEFATDLSADIIQLHSSEYRNPSQLQDGPVLVVGAGNSGADIAFELAATRTTHLSGKETGHIPFRIEGWFGRRFGIRLVWLLAHFVLTTNTPIGRRVRVKMLKRAAPLVRIRPPELASAGVRREARVVGTAGGLPKLEGDRALDVRNVIWCTGYHGGFGWIDLPIFDESGHPRHERGIVKEVAGLYFVGLHYQHAPSSAVITGVARDARYVVRALHRRARAAQRRPQSVPSRSLPGEPAPGLGRRSAVALEAPVSDAHPEL